MDLDLTGKLALVTGSTRGIGLATALGLARMGAQVIINGRTEPAVAEAIAKIKAAVSAAKTQAAAFDLGTAEGCAALIARFPAQRRRAPRRRRHRHQSVLTRTTTATSSPRRREPTQVSELLDRNQRGCPPS